MNSSARFERGIHVEVKRICLQISSSQKLPPHTLVACWGRVEMVPD
jgi:hypothetical protein